MPVLIAKFAEGRSIEEKRAFAKALTKCAVKHLKVKKEWVTVLIDEYPRCHWATGGELHLDKFGPGHGAKGTKGRRS